MLKYLVKLSYHFVIMVMESHYNFYIGYDRRNSSVKMMYLCEKKNS